MTHSNKLKRFAEELKKRIKNIPFGQAMTDVIIREIDKLLKEKNEYERN